MAKTRLTKDQREALRDSMMTYMERGQYEEAFSCIQHLYDDDHENYRLVKAFRTAMKKIVGKGETDASSCYELMHQSYILTAPDKFDDFMIALEWYRPDEEKFWLPRRKQLQFVADILEEFVDGDLDELFLSMPPRVGKALADDTPILTRNGWKNHGDLVVGDQVIGMDGKFKKVIAVHPKCQLDVLMEFTNGEKIQCHENHEWMLYDRGRRKNHTEETKYWENRTLDAGEPGKRGHRYILQLPYHAYIKGEKKDLPLDPYTLGVWLGDGVNTNPTICGDNRDHAIIERIEKHGWPVQWQTMHKTTGVMYYGFGFRKNLQQMGMCYSNHREPKRIPDEYLTASAKQRLELLAGLLDTDGTFTKKENRYHFSTAEESLRDSFIALLSTFGWRVCVQEHPPILSSSGIQGKHPYWQISFCPDTIIPCALERKLINKFSMRRAIALKSITRVEPKQGNCITVEGDGMYLCGRTMIPTHNTSLVMFFLIWYACKYPQKSNLYSSFTEMVVKTYYNGVLEVLDDPTTYDLKAIFPDFKLAATDAKDLLIDIGRKKKYKSITCRSIMGTLNGACDAEGLLIADDLHSGKDEARNKDLLMSKWGTVKSNLLSRAKSGCKILWIGTHWSLVDCISMRLDMLLNNPDCANIKFKEINLPALDANDESNFDYLFKKGFSTQDYKVIRASYEMSGDMAMWYAPYMGTPIESENSVFSPTDLRYFNGVLPKEDPDRIFMVVDPAWGGGDYVAAPIIYKYDDDMFIVDVVYNNGDKFITWSLLARKAIDWNVQAIYVEATRTTSSYADGLEDKLKESNYRVNMIRTTKHWGGGSGQQGKKQRIFDKAPDIRSLMLFLVQGERSKEYQMFMQNVFSFSFEGKNKHDDAPDSLAIAILCAYNTAARVQLRERIF